MQRSRGYRFEVFAASPDRQKIVARALRAAREEAGLQQVELGRLIGKTQGYVSKVEGGHQGVDVLLLFDIAIALGVDPAELYGQVICGFGPIGSR